MPIPYPGNYLEIRVAIQSKACDGRSRRWVRDLLADQEGSTYALLAAALIPMLGFAGIGIDLGRTYMASSRLQSAVDAAVLAAVRTEQIYPGTGTTPGTKTIETVQSYVFANMPDEFMGADQTAPVVSVTRVAEEIKVSVSVNAVVPTSLMRVFGYDTLPIQAKAVGVAGKTLPRAVEAMMVLDVTGSMDGNGGMPALKDSVKEFLKIIYGNSETRKNFAIGMMPYNVVVNVGRLLPSSRVEAIDGFTTKAATDSYGWKGCIYADPTKTSLSSNTNVIDADTYDMGKNLPGDSGVPKAEPFMYPPMWVDSFHYQDNRYKLGETTAQAIAAANQGPMRTALIRQYGTNICRSPGGSDVACSNDKAATFVHPDRLPSYSTWPTPVQYLSTVKPSNADNFVSKSPNYVCPSEALPVSYDRTKTDYINYANSLQPLFNIGTWHTQAMTWSYRFISRDDVFTRNRPADSGLRQVVIFMTDGNFDSRDDGLNVNLRTPNFQRDTAYTGYGSYADKRVVNQDFPSGTGGLNSARAAHRDAMALRFAKVCQAAKNDGIEIYTITFAISNNAEGDATREMFRRCATDRNTHFFETKNPSDLRAAFTTIAADLIDVHLEK
jgi:Flp pilus assembly protein TadG